MRAVQGSRVIAAPAQAIFDVLADPAMHPVIDGTDSVKAPTGGAEQRLALGSEFGMRMRIVVPYRITNRVVEFEEGRRIAWRHFGRHVWRWELEPVGASRTRVTHTYDWTRLTDSNRLPRARVTTPERLAASVDRLAALAEAL